MQSLKFFTPDSQEVTENHQWFNVYYVKFLYYTKDAHTNFQQEKIIRSMLPVFKSVAQMNNGKI